MSFHRGLGRGLSSLIPPKQSFSISSQTTIEESALDKRHDASVHGQETGRDSFIFLDPHEISANPYQPRTHFEEVKLQELASSIKVHGIINPLVVKEGIGGRYELISGERRLRAALEAGLKAVPAIVRSVEPRDQFELSVIENLQREDLNPIELGRAYEGLMRSFSMTQEELSNRLGISRSEIANTVRFLDLPEEIQESLRKGEISEGHAKIILSLTGRVEQLNLWKKITLNKMTVRASEKEARYLKGGRGRIVIANDPNLAAVERLLEEKFNTKVEIKGSMGGGRIIMHYFSREELEQIAGKE